MKLRCGAGLSEPTIVDDLRTIVVYDDFDNPIVVIQKLDEGQIYMCRAAEKDFASVLKALGIGLNATCIPIKRSQPKH